MACFQPSNHSWRMNKWSGDRSSLAASCPMLHWPRWLFRMTKKPFSTSLLLSEKAQLMDQELPETYLLEHPDVKWAILQSSHIPEHHHQRFCSLTLGKWSCRLASTQQHQDACQYWLLAEKELKQFISRLLEEVQPAEWVRHHHLASLDEAIHLAKDHLAAFSLSVLLQVFLYFSLSPERVDSSFRIHQGKDSIQFLFSLLDEKEAEVDLSNCLCSFQDRM